MRLKDGIRRITGSGCGVLGWMLWLSAALAGTSQAQSISGFCENGGVNVSTSGLLSSTTVQASYPSCTVTVYLTGTTTLASLYTNPGLSTTLANPFTASTSGFWLFYAATGVGYDINLSGGTPNAFPTPVVLSGLQVGGGASSVSAAQITAAIQTQSGCTTAGYAWNPATSTCLAPTFSGVLPVTQGGTGSSTAPTNGQVPYSRSGATYAPTNLGFAVSSSVQSQTGCSANNFWQPYTNTCPTLTGVTGSFNVPGSFTNTNSANTWGTIYGGSFGTNGSTLRTLAGLGGGAQQTYNLNQTTCNDAYPGWDSTGNVEFVTGCNLINHNSWTAGIDGVITGDTYKFATGDLNGVNMYYHGKLGWTSSSSEGLVGYRFDFSATGQAAGTQSSATATGLTSVSINCTVNCYTYAVGHPLVDTTAAVSASVTARTASAVGDLVTFTGPTITASSCTVGGVGAVTLSNATPANVPVLQTVTLTGLPSAWTVGEPFRISYSDFETSVVNSITSAFSGGNETITAYLIHPYFAGGSACAGGSNYQFVSNNYVTTNSGGNLYLFNVIGFPTTTTALVGTTYAGVPGGGIVSTLPSAVTFYPGSLITDSGNSCTMSNQYSTGASTDYCAYSGSSFGTVNVSVETNGNTWTSGDTLVNGNVVPEAIIGYRTRTDEKNPYAGNIGAEYAFLEATYTSAESDEVDGLTDPTQLALLSSHGGQYAPPIGRWYRGQFGNAILMDYFPTKFHWQGNDWRGCVICMFANSFPSGETATSYDLLTGSGHSITITPATNSIAFYFASVALPSTTIAGGSSLTGNQGAGALLQHSTGSYTTGHLVSFDNSGNTIDSGYAPVLSTSLTTSAATTDSVTVTGMTSSGHCSLDPTNASAIAATQAGVTTKATNSITVTHAATAGMTYDILCTPY